MCGIVGILHRDGQPPVSPETVRSMCRAIQHRGPDEDGFLIDGQVGLGMRRLSIIDLEGGSQPICNEDRSVAIVFNGEIYNYRDLRVELLARDHHLATRCDTETIAHLYEDHGPDCVKQLRGMFAFALWDANRRRLLLARDRFGIKPLYVVTASWGIAFASELKALHAVGLASGELDWDGLDSYFRLGYIPAPATPFRSVRKLEPGHLLSWHADGRSATTRYWDLPLQVEEPSPDVVGQVRDWIDESVTAHLVSDVPVAAFLSGGLDSSAVVSSMAIQGHGKAHAFTARYHGTGAAQADETELAKALAERYGFRLTVVDVEPDVRNIFEPIVHALDEPHADESAIPSWLISERVAAEYKVALAGTGGDELFAGYPRHIGLLLSAWYTHVPSLLRRLMSSAASALPEPSGAGLRVHRLKRFLRTSGGTASDRYLEMMLRLPEQQHAALFAPGLSETMGPPPARELFAELHEQANAIEGLRAALYLDYKVYLPDDLLHLSDRVAMAHSLEIRVPFVDHRLVDHAFPIPDRVRIGRLENKRLLKQSLIPRLPAAHFSAPKRGFVGPTAVWLRHELRDMLVDEVSAERLSRLGYFRPQAVTQLLDDHLGRRHNREGILWALLCFSTWHRLFVESQRPAAYTPIQPASPVIE